MKSLYVLLLLLCYAKLNAQKFENLALTPPMGWNSWNTFETKIDEKLVKDIADAFVKLGLKEAGYEYVVLDDGWMAKNRDVNGNLVADSIKFPSGMKVLSDYVHARGLKFGLYNCAGAKTCAGYPGSRGHEYQDAKAYASWDIDYLKYDWCDTDKLNAEGAYVTMRDALYSAQRPIVFSICEWGDNQPWKWGKTVGHLWRVSGDINNCWDCEVGFGGWSSLGVWRIINLRKEIRQFSGPDHWNDFDMMEVGNGMTDAEDRSHFAMWCILASPLILGNDLRKISPETLKTITNKEVIAINQDKLGVQGFRFTDKNGVEVWAKPLDNDDWAFAFVNMNNAAFEIDIDWFEHYIKDSYSGKFLDVSNNIYSIRDLFNHKNIGNTKTHLKTTIASHDVLMIRVSKQ